MLDLVHQATFSGPAFPEPFVEFELEKALQRRGLLPKARGAEGKALDAAWRAYRRRLQDLVSRGGPLRVANHVIEPVVHPLGYDRIEEAPEVETREGLESGGRRLLGPDGASLRFWATAYDEDLDAPTRRGRAYRYSHVQVAHRVLLVTDERVGLLTNGSELRILISDPARPGSQIEIPIDPHWKRSHQVPDTFRLLLALASPAGVRAVPDLVDAARLQQSRVTAELRRQAREAVEGFVQAVINHPENRQALASARDADRLAKDLWREGLVVVYRLLFILKLESIDDPARAFGFAGASLWRGAFSPSTALPAYVRAARSGDETGRFLEDAVRALFRMFEGGLRSSELQVPPLGGVLFGNDAIPTLAPLRWGESAVAHLLDRLLWTPERRGAEGRKRVHYGSLNVEELGRVYEALLELEPGIASEPMCRLRRQKLEVVLPALRGERYRPAEHASSGSASPSRTLPGMSDPANGDDRSPRGGRKTKVEWIEEIPEERFFLRVGLGRKASGSFYTPHSFVRFLVLETLGPLVAERSPPDNPQPGAILEIKVLDPAMGSGHFLVEACRFLGSELYEACRLCDDKARTAEEAAEKTRKREKREALLADARTWRQRVVDIPDPDDELVLYLPSHAPEGEESGLSQKKAEALCRRLVAVHCLYGVDKNPLAVGLAKLALWIESHAEGMPLTFLDHRLIVGDSLTGPFFKQLLRYPGSGEAVEDLFGQGITDRLRSALEDALRSVGELEASVGTSLSEVKVKESARRRIEESLAPFKVLAAAWAGGIMLGPDRCDDAAYAALLKVIAETGDLPDEMAVGLRSMVARGFGLSDPPESLSELKSALSSGEYLPAHPYDLAFPEVFQGESGSQGRGGFDAVLGNPPWEAIQFKSKEFFAAFDFEILNAPTKRERTAFEKRLTADPAVGALFERYKESFEEQKRANDALYRCQKVQVEGDLAGRQVDYFRVFMERNSQLLGPSGLTGVLVPSSFHANEGATGVRRLYLEQMGLACCYSFENRRKLFDIDSRMKFALVVASQDGPTEEFPCAFYLHDDEWLFGERGDKELRYTLDFVRRTGGEYLSFLELRSMMDMEVAEVCFRNGRPFGEVCTKLGIRFGHECDMTNDAWRFTPTADVLPDGEDPRDPDVSKRLLKMGYLVLHEGKTFHQFSDRWEDRPRYVLEVRHLDHRGIRESIGSFRLVFRDIAGGTDERTAIMTILPFGCATGDTAHAERLAAKRTPNCRRLLLMSVWTSFPAEWTLRQRVRAHVNMFIADATPIPATNPSASRLLVHGSLRLVANHAKYQDLWQEQLSSVWRESKPVFDWPVVEGIDDRWRVRSVMDALVADAFQLARNQYDHLLSTFTHKSYPAAPGLCLERFDELKSIGTEAFAKKYDPYWDVPLNDSPPAPVLQFAIPAPEEKTTPQQDLAFDEADRKGHWREEPAAGAQRVAERRGGRQGAVKDDGAEQAFRVLANLIQERGVITSADAQEALGRPAATVRPILKRLVEEGLATKEGQRRGTRYRLKQAGV